MSPTVFNVALLLAASLALCTASILPISKRNAAAVSAVFPQADQNGLLGNNTFFTLNGTELRILSGAMHYFRIPHQYWQDRLERLKALGLNTVETYVAWNLHEPSPGNYRFDGDLDARTFIQTAQRMGLHVILRPGPFICAEWEFGGLPSWLLRDDNMCVRTLYAPYMAAVDRWFAALFGQVGDLQYMQGGPIIAMQVENEYGSFGTDVNYVLAVGNQLIKHGATEFLFTADNDGGRKVDRIDGVLQMLTGAQGMAESLADLRQEQPNMPLMVVEFWSGWFDHWGEPNHHTWDLDDYLRQLDTILVEFNASINFYMAHGGTSFGFMAGANAQPTANNVWLYGSDVTSYDYDAPISEDGSLHPTKFNATRQLLSQVSGQPLPPLPLPPVRHAYGNASLNGYLPLYPEISAFANVDDTSLLKFITAYEKNSSVKPMELLDCVNNGSGQQYGYTVYRRDLSDVDVRSASGTLAMLSIAGGVRDRLTVVYGGAQQGTPYPQSLAVQQDDIVNIPLAEVSQKILNVIVENRGRVNFAQKEWFSIRDVLDTQRKGLQGTVTFTDDNNNSTILNGKWDIFPLEFNNVQQLSFIELNQSSNALNLSTANFPAMLRYNIYLGNGDENVHDSYLYVNPSVLSKGVAFVNGRNVGRFWSVGPLKALYVPRWYWNAGGGQQTIALFVEEAHPPTGTIGDFVIELKDTPDLGPV